MFLFYFRSSWKPKNIKLFCHPNVMMACILGNTNMVTNANAFIHDKIDTKPDKKTLHKVDNIKL